MNLWCWICCVNLWCCVYVLLSYILWYIIITFELYTLILFISFHINVVYRRAIVHTHFESLAWAQHGRMVDTRCKITRKIRSLTMCRLVLHLLYSEAVSKRGHLILMRELILLQFFVQRLLGNIDTPSWNIGLCDGCWRCNNRHEEYTFWGLHHHELH